MLVITRLAALVIAAFAFAAPASLAEDCDAVLLPRAVTVIQAVSAPGTALNDQMALMDGYIQSCPGHAWIHALGGELDVMIFKTLRTNNGGVANQEAVSFLARAFLRSNVFQEGPDEGRNSRYHVLGYQTQTHLDYSFASRSRSEIIKALADLAVAGTVHPYLKPETPPVCKGWLMSDTQAIASKITIASDMVLLPFVEAAADACRDAPLQIDRLPLSSLALAYMKLIEKEQVKDTAEITRLLIAARRNADDFIGDDGYYSLLFGESEDQRLKALTRKYGVHTGDGPATIDRSLWFTKEYIGTEVAIRSLAFSFGGYWTPLASGDTDAPGEDVAKARNKLSGYILELRKQGTEAGFPEETTKMLTETLTAFQKGEIGPPETMGLKPIPPWLLSILLNLAKPPEATPAE